LLLYRNYSGIGQLSLAILSDRHSEHQQKLSAKLAHCVMYYPRIGRLTALGSLCRAEG